MKGYKVSWTSPCGMDGQSTHEYFFLNKEKAIKKFREIIKMEIQNDYLQIFDSENENIKYHFHNDERLFGWFNYYNKIDLTNKQDVEGMLWQSSGTIFKNLLSDDETFDECREFLMKIGQSKFTNEFLILEITIKEIEIDFDK